MSGFLKSFEKYLTANNISIYKAERQLGMSNGSLGKAIKRGNAKHSIIEKILNVYPNFNINNNPSPHSTPSMGEGDKEIENKPIQEKVEAIKQQLHDLNQKVLSHDGELKEHMRMIMQLQSKLLDFTGTFRFENPGVSKTG